MALTAQTTLDIPEQTQTIVFYEGASVVDQITYSGGNITFSAILGFNLSKSDLLLYFKYLQIYLAALYTNFIQSTSGLWPLCLFEISETNIGVLKIIYTQNSQGVNVYTITYVPIAVAASFTSRANPITISLQEFYMTLNMLTQYINQVLLN